MAVYQCINCGKEKKIVPARIKTAKFCSYQCRGEWRSKNWTGSNNPRWFSGQIREKTCQFCGKQFQLKPPQPITSFKKQKFCSKECADRGGLRYAGENHPNWKPDARRKNRPSKANAWARAVIGRDNATCQKCGAQEVELHAHHIKSYADHPDLRWKLSNGLTLCHKCHWEIHTAPNANEVNSGKLPPATAEDNPEPSNERKFVEGVTTRGQAYRRWNGECEWCHIFISKRWSDAKGKAHLFCSRSCAAKFLCAQKPIRQRR